MSPKGTYRALFGVPGVRAQAVLGLLAQVTQQVTPIGAVLVVGGATGSLVLGGLAAAAFSVGAGMARPVQGRLIDRCGPRPVLAVTGCLHTTALVVLAGATGVPSWGMVALAWLAGTGLPPVSVAMRIEWARLTSPGLRTATYSLVYLVQELAIFVGPLLFSGVVAVLSASIALTVVAVAAGAGTLALAQAMRSAGARQAGTGGAGVLRDGRMRLLLGVVALLGGASGAMEVGLPALAVARGAPAASGLLLATVAFGGIAGALCYGRLRWSVRPARRLVVLLLAVGATLLPAALAPNLVVIGFVLFFVGIALNPALTTASLVVDELDVAPAEAFGWLSTAISAGAAASGGLAGVVGEYAGAAHALLLAFGFAVLGAALSLALARPA
ncbi:MFS transporter [Actinomadura sp. DC4]|uniref:MFS transporter n=1 Tax=Actinomadura sp. DC4 TaxID=3055069 RepID=UPI0025AF396A|nr:MFS transporter [Actinomadura sp. DC4]MDN3353622.1 MFS transporter [Actinomadura sp. DC4]